jgi:hypothetical protein
MLGVSSHMQELGDKPAGGHTNRLAPMKEPLRRPLHVRTMCGLQVFGNRCVATFLHITCVTRYPLTTVQDLNGARRHSSL